MTDDHDLPQPTVIKHQPAPDRHPDVTQQLDPGSGQKRLSQFLHQAIADGHVAKVRSLLDQGVDANVHNGVVLPSDMSERYQTFESSRTLAMPKAKRSFSIKWTRSNSKSETREKFDRKTHSESTMESITCLQSEFESAALFQAVKEGLDLAVQTLLETSHIDKNGTDEKGLTPVMQAAWHGQTDCLRILLDYNADPLLCNATGCSAIHFAAGQGQLECLKILLDSGVPVNARTHFGATPLILASKSGNSDCVRTLLSRGADARARYRGNQSALIFAASYGHYECVQLLLTHGLPADDWNSAQITPLMRAAQHAHNDCLVLLLEHGANHRRQDINGRTAMHYAVEGDNAKAVKILLKYGADPEATTKRGSTTYTYCERYASFKCKEILDCHCKKQRASDVHASNAHSNGSRQALSCIKLRMIIRGRRQTNNTRFSSFL